MNGYLECDVVFLTETDKLVKYDEYVRAQGELRYHLIEVP